MPRQIDWPSGGAPPTEYKRTYFGHFFGDGSPDGILLADDDAYLVFEPEFFQSIHKITPSGETVVAIAPVKVANPDPWGVAMATDGSDLYLYEHPGPATVIASGSPWNGLVELQPANLDGAGKTDLVAATASGVYTLEEDGSGWSAGASVALTGTFLDLVPVDSNHDGIDEFAVLTTSGLYVYDASGSLLDYYPGPASSGQIAPIPPMTGFNYGRVAWVYPSGSNKILLICSPGNVRTNEGAFTAAPAALASAVYKEGIGGRRVDLATSADSDLYLRYFEHLLGRPYDPTDPDAEIEVGTSTPGGACRFAFGDISGDLVPDILIGRPADDALYFVPGEKAEIGENPSPNQASPFIDPSVEEYSGDYWFITHLDVGTNTQNYTHVQLVMWRTEDSDVLDPLVVDNRLFEIGDPDFDPDAAQAAVGADIKVGILLEDDDEDCDTDQAYYLTARLCTVTGTPPRPDDTGPYVAGGFSNDQQLLDDLAGPSSYYIPLINDLCTPPETPSPGIAPGFLRTPKSLRMPSSIPPDPGDPQGGTLPGFQ